MITGRRRLGVAAVFAAATLAATILSGTVAPQEAGAITRKEYVGLAQSQVGTGEVPAGSNRQKYGRAYGLNGVAWCQQFDWWLHAEAGLPRERTASTVAAVASASKRGTWHQGPKGIQPGDSVYFHWPSSSRPKGQPDHVGTVESVLPGGRLGTIEGNVSSRVMRKARHSKLVLGYIRNEFEVHAESPKEEPPTPIVRAAILPGPVATPWSPEALQAAPAMDAERTSSTSVHTRIAEMFGAPLEPGWHEERGAP